MRLEDWADEQCVWCGKEYAAKQVWQKYCSTACKEESRLAFNKQVRQSTLAALRCQCCGEPMPHALRTHRQFCSKSCRRKAATISKKGPLEEVTCHDCGDPIPGVLRRDTMRCLICARAEDRRRGREYMRRRRSKAHNGKL